MIMNKKLDRFKQWAGERMGGEVKTSTSEDFKDLEKEMGLRYEGKARATPMSLSCVLIKSTIGMDRLQKSMTVYVKSMSKRNDGNEKEKTLPVFNLGHTMVGHSEDFDPDSEFGNCLAGMFPTGAPLDRVLWKADFRQVLGGRTKESLGFRKAIPPMQLQAGSKALSDPSRR